MTALTSLGLFIFAVIAYSIKELQSHSKLKWMDDKTPFDFWGTGSWTRKYEKYDNGGLVPGWDHWYYNFFKIKYRERWPTSATLTVFMTDAAHLMQTLFKLFLIGSLVSYKEMVNPWVDGLIYFGIWGVCFTIVYKELSK